jgi:hypothetical protein
VHEALASERPAQLKEPNEGNWKAWAQEEDNVVRARLEQGALDSMINLLLFGTSFTTQPRVITMRDFEDPVVQARVADLVEALRDAKNNERLIFLRNILQSRGIHPEQSAGLERTKTFVLENLRRVVQEQNTIRERFDEAGGESDQEAGVSKRSLVFRDRGISVDTTILSSFGIEGALRDMKDRAVLAKRSITRVAVIGPGLDFTDKGFGYDFYPFQTLNSFSIYSSLFAVDLRRFSSICAAHGTAPKKERTTSCNCPASPGHGLPKQFTTGVHSAARSARPSLRFNPRQLSMVLRPVRLRFVRKSFFRANLSI